MLINLKIILPLVVKIITAVILLEILYFIFIGHPESVAFFAKLGLDHWGKICTGLMGLITCILLFIPASVFIGSLFGYGLMSGLILSHLIIIGFEPKGYERQLLLLLLTDWILFMTIMMLNKQNYLDFLKWVPKKPNEWLIN